MIVETHLESVRPEEEMIAITGMNKIGSCYRDSIITITTLEDSMEMFY